MIDFTVRPLHFRRHDPFHPAASVLWTQTKAPDASVMDHHPTQDRYVLQAIIGIEFWANPAELETATEIARRTALQGIHAEILSCISELRFAVYNGDRERAMELVGLIENFAKGTA